jgi:dolichol-phosphate mannosyltransferase
MSDEKRLVSVVCPAYQEEEVLPLFHRELAGVLATLEAEYRFEIVYADDGSRDRTLDVIKQLARTDPRVGYVSLSRNFGHQTALTAGLEHARGDLVISMDCDLQHPPAVLPRLLDKWKEGHDVVITIRADDRRLGLFKRLTSRAFYRVMAVLSDTDVRLAASDFRLLTRTALDALLRMREQHRFLRGMVQWVGFPSAEIEFMPDERRAGRSKYTLRRMLRLAGDGLYSFSRVPLRLASGLGGLFLALAGGQAAWLGWLLVAGDGTRPLALHYLLLVVHLVGGTVLCGLGFLGEYVGRIYEEVKGRPLYLLKDQSASATGTLQTPVPPARREAA